MKDIIKKYLRDFKIGTKKMFKEFFNKKTIINQLANMLTFTRLIIPFITLILSIAAIITSLLPLFVASGIIAGMGALTDYFDGKISRSTKTTSEYGKMLDQLSDKFFTGIISINLLFLNPNYVFILIGELIISSINMIFKLKYKELSINSTMIGKVKQWPLNLSLIIGYLSTINNFSFAISNISIIITFLFQLMTAGSYINNNKNEIKKINNTKKSINVNIDTDKNDELVNVKNYDNTININNNLEIQKKITIKEQYQKLRDVLNLIVDNKTNEEIIDIKQKKKK